MSTIVSINTSPVQVVQRDGRSVYTAIQKKPRDGAVAVHPLGLAGDDQADKRYHGGPHQAVYLYSVENYERFRNELANPGLPLGLFGENLTVTELDEDVICVGDRVQVGQAGVGPLLEATSPRMPCSKLAMVMEDLAPKGGARFVKHFLETGRLGWYARVLETGTVRAGDELTVVHRDPARVSVRALAWLRSVKKGDVEGMRKAVAVKALHPEWKSTFEERLAVV